MNLFLIILIVILAMTAYRLYQDKQKLKGENAELERYYKELQDSILYPRISSFPERPVIHKLEFGDGSIKYEVVCSKSREPYLNPETLPLFSSPMEAQRAAGIWYADKLSNTVIMDSIITEETT